MSGVDFKKAVENTFSENVVVDEGNFYKLSPLEGLVLFVPKGVIDSVKETFVQTEGLFPIIVGAKMLVMEDFNQKDNLFEIMVGSDYEKGEEEYDVEKILNNYAETEYEGVRVYDVVLTISGKIGLPEGVGIPLDENGLVRIELINVLKPAE